MTRAVPASLFLHLLTLAMILWFGSHVARQVIPRQRTIAVRVLQLERPRIETPPPEAVRQEKPPIEVEAEPVVREEMHQEPAKVPDQPQQPAEIVEPAPDTAPAPQTREPVVGDTVAGAETDRAPVLGTDTTVAPRFQYYLDLLESRIARNWHPKQLGFRQTSQRVCRIHFHVEQNGLITRETIVQSSGVPLMDRESLAAIRNVGHFMPLPRGLANNALGVTYTFTLTSGN